MIVNAVSSDADTLTKIALESKAIWGYTAAQIESWTEELTVSQKMVEEMIVFKFLQNEMITGFCILNKPIEDKVELEFLFVLPEFLGKGIGKKLLHHSFKESKNRNCKEMTLLADPFAEVFYESQGFKTIGQKESNVFNRFLPVMHRYL